jgi:hypothetical protein
MALSPVDFQKELARSREYEVAFSRWLECERGFYTLPVFDCSGPHNKTAPALYGDNRRLVAPDIMACKNGTWSFFEIKLKERADLHRITGDYVTGLPLRNWQHYMEIQRVTRTPVWIVFVHLREQEVLADDITMMSSHHIHHESTMDNGGTVFFRYSDLRRLMRLERLQEFMGGR